MAKSNAGRPLNFKTVEELQTAIDAYFADCDPHLTKCMRLFRNKKGHLVQINEQCITEQRPYTITGLAVALGCDRDTLLNYKKRELFGTSIQAAKNCIHAYAEESLWTAKNAAGNIFNLTNNWSWKNKTEVDNNHIFPSVAELAKNARDERATERQATSS